jgi:hypothetical protein
MLNEKITLKQGVDFVLQYLDRIWGKTKSVNDSNDKLLYLAKMCFLTTPGLKSVSFNS